MERRVPWRDWGEWFEVYRLLFSQNLHDRQKGLEIVTHWRVFGSVGVPVSIDSTAHIIEIQDDEHLQVRPELFRLSMTCAITRLVNGVVEENQVSVFADSVMRIARRIGLPETLVELRHDGTHDALPSFSALKHASQVALNWLYERYWVKQAEKVQIVRSQLEGLLHTIGGIVGRRRQDGEGDSAQRKMMEENEFKNEIAKEVWENISEMRKYIQSPNDLFDFVVPSLFSHEIAMKWLSGRVDGIMDEMECDEDLCVWIQKSTRKTWKLFFLGLCDVFPTFPRVMFQQLVHTMGSHASSSMDVNGILKWLSFFLHHRHGMGMIHPTTLGSVLLLLKVLVRRRASIDSRSATTVVHLVAECVRGNDDMKGTILDRIDVLWDMIDKYGRESDALLKSLDESTSDGVLDLQRFSSSFQQSAIGEVPYPIAEDDKDDDEIAEGNMSGKEKVGNGDKRINMDVDVDVDVDADVNADVTDSDETQDVSDVTGNVYYLF
eukprot:TRINITY_DN488_c5_g1_i1.p1 TRINITY_DN488_c5_g1~~TRINITY_DN488_c5_g1_i1.p1  ORF type:complete len:492 (-),score=130.14 TRINITY_DN488_c5_g1_i1:24-1499(-)